VKIKKFNNFEKLFEKSTNTPNGMDNILDIKLTPRERIPFRELYPNKIILLYFINGKDGNMLFENHTNDLDYKDKTTWEKYLKDNYDNNEFQFHEDFSSIRNNNQSHWDEINEHNTDNNGWWLSNIHISKIDIK